MNLDFSDDLPLVVGDNDELTQVFQNLVENAIKYSTTGSEVRIFRDTSSGGAKSLCIGIQDIGEGIDPTHIPRLTERFYRVDSHRSRNDGGTGLGLAIVKHIVQRHRGRLKIESEVGRGSTFTVLLPAE